MSKSMMIGSVIGAIVVTAGGAFAGYKSDCHLRTRPLW